MARLPRVFTIPPGARFLDELVAALLDGRLPAAGGENPFALADLTLYLPTRRAARAVRDSFLRALGRPVILPRISTIADIDDEVMGIVDIVETEDATLPPAASAQERQLVLTQMVLGWSGALVRATAGLGDEPLLVPASPADAARLASALGGLMDQMAGERVGWEGLSDLAPGDLSRYWDITLEFLRIATRAWPDYLAERGLVDPAARRNALIRRQAERLRQHGSPHPVIAAGSTGSVPATAELLAAIARLENGAVVLPGLDRDLDAESWQALDAPNGDPAAAGHPQYGLKRLIDALGVRREDVEPLARAPQPLARRVRFLSDALRPAATTDRWAAARPQPGEALAALEGLALVVAANEREEALSVALVLRRAVEEGKEVAALVTPDRALARRVADDLERWGLKVDDSAGTALHRTPPGVLAALTAEVALAGAAAEPLLALLKHPLALFGWEAGPVRAAARALERALLRGPRIAPGLAALRHAFAAAEAARRAGERPSEAARRLDDADWRAAARLLDRLEAALDPLCALAENTGPVPLQALLAAHLAAIEAVARDPSGATPALAEGEAGEALSHALATLIEAAPRGPEVRPRDYPTLFSALIAERMVRPGVGADPRIHIWGALEARLQHADLVVLGGLNEGTWPSRTRSEPFLSRPMRAALGLEPPERRLGLSAHDFAQALGHPEVWLTRAKRQDGEPRVASRWLQRILALAGEEAGAALARRGAPILELARRLDRAEGLHRPAARPQPVPPLDLRPKRLSVTDIETLIRDPYAIHARHVLGLSAFEPLAAEPDAAERGSLVHDILARFVKESPRGPYDARAQARLLEMGREAFARLDDFPETRALWWPRFERVARWLVAYEAERSDARERLAEISGALEVDGVMLRCRADRIDRLADGRLRIVDYKTGAPPSVDQVLALSPQLLLEGLIAEAGGFDGVPAAAIAELEYYHLSGRGEGGLAEPRGFRPSGRRKPEVTLREALERTQERLRRDIVARYADPASAYVSRRVPRAGQDFSGEYDHLARAAEWYVGAEE